MNSIIKPLFSISTIAILSFIMTNSCSKDSNIVSLELEAADANVQFRGTLPPGFYDVNSIAFDAPSKDLKPFGKLIGNAKVVGLGESAHYSLGYAKARARLIRYLIEEKGFRAIGYESIWTRARLTNDFIHGEGTIENGLVGLTFLTWRNDPTAELLEWIRDWNTQHPEDDVVLFGFDIQSGVEPANYLRERIQQLVDSGELTVSEQQAIIEGMANCPGAGFNSILEAIDDPVEGPIITAQVQLPRLRHLLCLESMSNLSDQILDLLEEDLLTYTRAAIRTLEAYSGYLRFLKNPGRGQNERDAGMADVFEIFRNDLSMLEGKKIVNVAHNVHNQKSSELINEGGDGIVSISMGNWLDERLGAKYRPIGFFAQKVEVIFPGNPYPTTWVAEGEDSLEKTISNNSENSKRLIVDLNLATKRNSALRPGKDYEFGQFRLWAISQPILHFDGLFYMDRSKAD